MRGLLNLACTPFVSIMDTKGHAWYDGAMNVRLTPQQQEFIESQVTKGRYLSNSEVIREGLRLLQEETEWKADVRRKITEGLLQVEADKVVDGPEAIGDILETLSD